MNTRYIDKLQQEYIEKHTKEQIREELIFENNVEKRDIKGYHGREILELLQNADDAYQKSVDSGNKPDCELNVQIAYKQGILTVSNTGTFFDESGIKAIVQGNNSPKKGKYIGSKGTGFRSVLNWADKVRIFSGEFAVEFSKDIASEIFDKIKHEPQIEKQLATNPLLYIPMLAVPKNIPHNRPKDCTTIEVYINPDKQNDDYSVEKQLAGIDLRILLFLPNVSKISISTENAVISYKRLVSNDGNGKPTGASEVQLIKQENDEIVCEERYLLFRKDRKGFIEDGDTKDIQLAVAVPCDCTTRIKHVYSYFPLLETDSPFNCVLHATYSLGDHRNTIVSDDINKSIIKSQLDFLIEIANILVRQKRLEEAYRILRPLNYQSADRWGFSSSYSKFNLDSYYIDKLAEQPIFRTVNDEFISLDKAPEKIDGECPEVFRGCAFEKLLKSSDDRNLDDLINLIAYRKNIDLHFEPNDLLVAVNSVSDSWTVRQQVEVFVWWNIRFRNCGLLPHLLKTQKDEWVQYKQDCFFLEGDFDSVELPEWVETPTLHLDYQDTLVEIVKNNSDYQNNAGESGGKKISPVRFICQNNIFPVVGFKYRDRNNIIPLINSSVDTYEKAVQFVKWLWTHYRNDVQQNNTTERQLNFPSVEKTVVKSDSLYLGKSYGNIIANKLFDFDKKFQEFPDSSLFNIEENDRGFRQFLERLGILTFPKIENKKTTPIPCFETWMKLEIINSGAIEDTSSTDVIIRTYRVTYINGLEEILSSLSMSDILRWVLNDDKLSATLSMPYDNDGEISYHGNSQWKERIYCGKIPNYILAVFNNTSWIEIEGKRYSPKQVLKGFDSKSNQRFQKFIPVMTVQMIERLAKDLEVEYDELNSIFRKFAFADKVTDLSSEEFYGLLLELQESGSSNYELSKAIYRIVEQSNFSKTFEDSANKTKFFSQGQLLVKYQGELRYHLSRDSYLPSTKIINKKEFPIVEKGQRTNNKNFKQIFGCQEYENDSFIIPGSEIASPLNDEFQTYFNEFINYARAYSERNDNIEKQIGRLRVTIVEHLDISENGKIVSVTDDYSLIKDSMTNWFIVVGATKYDINLVSENIEDIFSNMANTSGFDASKLGELFRASSEENRKFLIRKDFGSLDIIDDSHYSNEIKRNFFDTLQKVTSRNINIKDVDVDFDRFESHSSVGAIIELLKKNNIDMDDFVKAGFVYPVRINEYWKSEMEDLIDREKEHFKDALFCKALDDSDLQKTFISRVDEFENFSDIAEIRNSVTYDPAEELINIFGDWRAWQCDRAASTTYSKNYEELNPDRLYEDEIANNQNVQRMIYFGLHDEFTDWLNARRKMSEIPNNKPQDQYARFRDVVPDFATINHQEGKSITDMKPGRNHHGTYTQSSADERNKNKKQLGNIGELLVYNLLCHKYGESAVKPHSEAFVDLGILKPGQAVSGKYDISYTDDSGNEFYVEVKTGDKNMFFMSPGEFEFAKSHPSNYYVYYVYDVHGDAPKYHILPLRFWTEETRYRAKEIIEKIEFRF